MYWSILFTKLIIVKYMKKFIISIEGNIGVGKSSLLDKLRKDYINSADFIVEPVEEWLSITNDEGKNILDVFYNDKKRWSYTFQNIAYITRMQKIIDVLLNSEKQFIIMDRSLDADLNTFANLLHKDGCLDDIEWNAYNKWNNFFQEQYGNIFTHIYVYLKCDPNVSKERILKRGREAEKNIDMDYLEKISKCHDDWLINNNNNCDKSNIIIIDVNKDFVSNEEHYKYILGRINNIV